MDLDRIDRAVDLRDYDTNTPGENIVRLSLRRGGGADGFDRPDHGGAYWQARASSVQ